MRKTALFGLLAIPLVFLLSACFVLQGFWIKSNQITVGGKGTKAVFEIRPGDQPNDRAYQFFLIGVDDSADLRATKGTWGVNREFGGPYPLAVEPGLYTAIDTSCDSELDLSGSTGLTWKGYATPNAISDKNRSKTDVLVEVGIKATNSATDGDHEVVGVTGAWFDDGDGVPEDGADTFACLGSGQVSVNVKVPV